jgi:hypothetical protein
MAASDSRHTGDRNVGQDARCLAQRVVDALRDQMQRSTHANTFTGRNVALRQPRAAGRDVTPRGE